ncbi:MAG: hypothetical protein N3G76_02735 [Candidatus Micrarchaeota archaeon]|nr:hypothetical protein [Candidatus Micrarchaeota archaeon]
MPVDLFRIFKRVMSRITGRGGRVRERVDDVPSSFLVSFAQLKQRDKGKFDSYAKAVGAGDDPEAAASTNELIEYVSEMQHKGRNRNKIENKAARKSTEAKATKAKVAR